MFKVHRYMLLNSHFFADVSNNRETNLLSSAIDASSGLDGNCETAKKKRTREKETRGKRETRGTPSATEKEREREKERKSEPCESLGYRNIRGTNRATENFRSLVVIDVTVKKERTARVPKRIGLTTRDSMTYPAARLSAIQSFQDIAYVIVVPAILLRIRYHVPARQKVGYHSRDTGSL
ncbi:hypothetical protein PUN28_018863 [Cardiocondyla obscurior]|uniref:Uncharacterized protein n=1 Tax=Cardiocondyla obscurior TaxID=286306 RepID=A0AAW2EDR3_9HYME